MDDLPNLLVGKETANGFERNLGRVLFATRWVMLPMYIGMVAALVLLTIKFVQSLMQTAQKLLALNSTETTLAILQLVDITLVANLLLIVLFGGWERFIGPLLSADRVGLGGLGFSIVKLRLVGSIAAIASIQLLETFLHVDERSEAQAMWQLAILVGIAITGVLLALMDYLAEGRR